MEIENLIIKYLTNEISAEELDALSEWIENSKDQRIFDDLVKVHYEINVLMNEPDVDAIKKAILSKMQQDRRLFNKPYFRKGLKYAAILLMIVSLGYIFHESNIEKTANQVVAEQLVPKEEAITIEFGDGKSKVINPEENGEIKDSDGNILGKQTKGSLNYPGTAETEDLVYNTLNIPYGKRFDVVLSDGTHVYLNSGTSLKYPVKFIANTPREVVLNGEAYFDVAKDAKNPFLVHSDSMVIEVLGTKFNVSNYPENDRINTVLVEGSIALNQTGKMHDGEGQLLEPGFMAQWSKEDNKVALVDNVDTRVYTAWIDGKLVFRNNTFRHIRLALERYYNVEIINNNKILDEQRFDATFDIETINEVLETFSKSYAIEFSVVNNRAFIK